MSRITVIDGHPHSARSHYVHALARTYAEAAAKDHVVRIIELALLDFPVLRDPEEWRNGALPSGLQAAQEAVGWAEHLVFVYPLWLGDVPALLKAFLEQVARPGFAIEPGPDGAFGKLLQGKSARIIVSMGMPAAGYRFYFLEHSVRSLKRNILQFVGISPVRITLIGNVEDALSREKGLRTTMRLGRLGR